MNAMAMVVMVLRAPHQPPAHCGRPVAMSVSVPGMQATRPRWTQVSPVRHSGQGQHSPVPSAAILAAAAGSLPTSSLAIPSLVLGESEWVEARSGDCALELCHRHGRFISLLRTSLIARF